MRILDQYLHPLFLDHDCIVVPGLGGFVCNRQPAQYNEGRQELTPPYRSVLFNERLVHHDGVLAQAVSRAQGITFDQAVKAIELEVAQMKTDITGGSTVAIERVGRLYKGRNERVQFLADEEMERMLRSFGLRNIPLRPIAEVTAKSPIINPRRGRWFRCLRRLFRFHWRALPRRWPYRSLVDWECSLPIVGTCKTGA